MRRNKTRMGLLDFKLTDNFGQTYKASHVDLENGLVMLKNIMKHKIGR